MGKVVRRSTPVWVVLLALGSGCGPQDPCAEAAEILAGCGLPTEAFVDGCRAQPQWAAPVLAEGCQPLQPLGKADGAGAPQPPAVKARHLVLDTARDELSLYRAAADETPLVSYKVSLGRGEYLSSAGKQREGDHRTPRGSYRLFAGRPSKFNRFLPVSYPNAEDAARGLAAGLIGQAEHDVIVAADRAGTMPPQDTALGGAIGIHGFGTEWGFVPPQYQHLHHWVDVSQGCVVVTDAEIVVLVQSYVPGAVIEIR